MKNFKKTLAVGLSAAMLMSSFAYSSSAKTFEDVASDHRFAEQINIISDIGVTKGTSDTEYSPEAKVTREQMALLLYRLMVGNENSGKVNTTPFIDLTDDTYKGAISWAYSNGYILGTSDTTFSPREGITLRDAMTMLVRILGHETDKMASGYPWTYIDSAIKLELDLELDGIEYDKELTRGETAAILYNALTSEYLVVKSSVGGNAIYESTTIIEKIFGYKLAEATIVATDDHAIGSASVVVKDDHVSLAYDDNGEKMITVKYSELGLKGDANDHLGKRLKVVYSLDRDKNVKVLGATELGREEVLYEGIDVYENKKTGEFDYVEIGETRYQVVKTLSDKLSTNANELLVYSYSSTGKLTQIESNEELNEALGIYMARVIYDGKNDEVASRIILMPYSFAKLEISDRGEYNIANDLKKDELKGGITNTAKAEDGDYVLYYFNEENLSLNIVTAIPVSSAETVSKITDDTAKLGGKTYKLGCEALGITASSIKRELTVGEKVHIVAVNGMILAIEDGVFSDTASNYLITLTNSRPVFTNGRFGYAIKVNLDGETLDIFSETDDVIAGRAYRYTVDDDGIYSLIPYVVSGGVISTGSDGFVQNGSGRNELAVILEEADKTIITSTDSSYTLDVGDASFVSSSRGFSGEISFVTDENTVMIVRESDGKGDYIYNVKKGVFDGSITVNDGAYVAAVLEDEVGSVETLAYLYISNGSFGHSTSSTGAVKILEAVGSEYVGGKVYSIYNVLELDTGEVKHYHSVSGSLTIGANYKLNNDGTISSVGAEVASGILTGYTSSTVTIGSKTYALASKVNVYEIDDEFEVTSLKLSSAYMSNVEFVVDDDKVIAIAVLGDAPMSASYESGIIKVECDFEFAGVGAVTLRGLKKDGKSVDITGYAMSRDDKLISVTPAGTLEHGEYTLSFNLGDGIASVDFTVSE